ncbi:hypothetical protein [Pontibacter sp. 172403-2]|uniref:hypothetical protein n=1 Tax=Pontibacter rufus TaxID=2791028 RepID=UPI001E56F637|nr:hypothetical protein [Pontibacter sp. 172403-2]
MNERILSFLGRLYLQLCFRDENKLHQELRRKYNGAYRNAGLVLLFDMLMALATVAAVALVAAVLYFVIA